MKYVLARGLFFANPSTPYGVYDFNNTLFPKWQLDEKEAIIFFGCTAPPARYLGYRSYLFSRNGTAVFASLGDTINNLIVNSSDRTGANPFGKTMALITTADITTDSLVRRMLAEAGIPSTAINTDIIPSSIARMGRNSSADEFAMLHRAAIFQDANQSQAFFNTTWPVFLVTPPSQQPRNPFALPPQRIKGNGTNENSFNSSLTRFLTEVNNTVKQNYSQFSAAIPDRMRVVNLEGFECIETLTMCLGDNR